jgi:iron complex outermembrane recepter protein
MLRVRRRTGRSAVRSASHRLVFAFALGLPLAAAQAQTVAAAGDGSAALDTVTVTARHQDKGYVAKNDGSGTKTDTPLLETPQAISVITRAQLDEQNVQNLSQALGYTAGVSVNSTGTDTRYDWPTIRGFSADIYGLYLDGLRWMPNQLSGRIESYGLERIEILKGPASVLYGENAPGGLIAMSSRLPTEAPQHEVQGDYGSYDQRQLKTDLGGPIDFGGGDGGNAHWLYRFTAVGHDDNTQIDFTRDKRLFLAPAVTWKPDGDTRLTILANFQRDILTSLYPFLPAQGTVLPNPNGRVSTSFFAGDTDFNAYSRNQYALGYLFERRLGDNWSFRQNFRYNRFRVDDWKQEYAVELEPDLRTLLRRQFSSPEDSRVAAVDNQLEGHWNFGLVEQTFLAGIDYSWQKLAVSEADITSTSEEVPIDIFNPVYGQPVGNMVVDYNQAQNLSQLGVYLQDQVKIDRKWVVLLGGRQDWVDSKIDNHISASTTTQDNHHFSGRAGLVYLSDIGMAPYLSYSESFVPNAGLGAGGAPLNPTIGRQYEGGIKYQPHGFNSFITVSAFDIRESNVDESDPANPVLTLQTGEVRSRGVEVEGVAALAQGLNLRLAWTADPVHTIKSIDPTQIGVRPTVTPEHMASLWADYVVQRGPLDGFGVGAGVRYVGNTYGGTYGAAGTPFNVPSYTVVDAALHYDWRGLRFGLNAGNLLDRQYVAACYSGTGCSYGTRRDVIGSVRYAW